jgi:lipoprotein-anchoring transpeptidase ErfK/SrfK
MALLTVTAGLVSACGPGAAVTAAQPSPTAPPIPFTMAITPAAGTGSLPISTEVGLAVAGGTVTDVALTAAGNPAKVSGHLRDDNTSWVPDEPLKNNTGYSVTVTGKSKNGKLTLKRTTSFSTMADTGRETGTGLYLFDGETVGVAMPVVIEFEDAVADSARADIQRRLFVTTTPAQPGVWHWASGKQVWYRPPAYWKTGTTISVRAALKGVPTGNGSYGDTDRSATVTVGQKVFMDVDNATKQMSVYVEDKLAKQMPVSLGKASTPSSSGNMVTMSHDYSTIFDTTAEGPGGYRVQVNYAMRLTWGGEFIHAAPWSVGDQGVRNVSHGCVNMSMDNSAWLFNITHIGDPVSVRGTEVALVNGNGWTAWNQNWADYIKDSALPVPAALAAAGNPPAPSGTPVPAATKGH